jgi:VanZ family protein
MRSPSTARRRSRLVVSLATLYALALAVALLMPAPDTPVPQHEHRFLEIERLRTGRMSVRDAVINVVVFVPAGLLCHAALRGGAPATAPVTAAVMAGGLALSLGAESLQYVIPGRYSSAGDVLANAVGLALGVIADRLTGPPR